MGKTLDSNTDKCMECGEKFYDSKESCYCLKCKIVLLENKSKEVCKRYLEPEWETLSGLFKKIFEDGLKDSKDSYLRFKSEVKNLEKYGCDVSEFKHYIDIIEKEKIFV